ncbi:LodA/GoxA family CTQ-dependent oxidase [Kitasatospora sp. NPDC002551]|uniref:LodA/GoxA family CTQ-dependent oxidase n=1 Tax=Kitasatospora sp. NPDC002551 TaxID=3154539 RepID=UPI00331F9097
MTDDIAYARIHPAIGIARVGNSTRDDGWFYGPEVPDPPAGQPGFYKDEQGAIKRQAARFRIYGYTADGRAVRELTLADPKVTIEWSVHVANKKAAWYEFSLPLDIPDMKDKPEPRRNATIKDADRATLVIDPGPKTLVAGSKTVVEFTGGSFLGTPVPLGRMHTDEAGRLVVLGGVGKSRNPRGGGLHNYGNNDGWCDDTSDGPVGATVTVDGKALRVDPAWVVVAPPNYAPDVKTVRTLYDVLYDLFVAGGQLEPPKTVNFDRDVKPILHRFCELQWVNKGFATHFGFGGPEHFLAPDHLARLGNPSEAYQELRRQVYTSLRDPKRDGISPVPWPWIYGDGMRSTPAPTALLQYLTLSPTQDKILLSWMQGTFETTPWPGFPQHLPDAPVADQPGLLDRAALDFCLGDAFHPGCEVTWPIRYRSMYSEPLRIRVRPAGTLEPDYGDHLTQARALGADGPLHQSGPGDLTRWMAVPWQTDTASCRSGYESVHNLGPRYDPYLPTFWPARVPNHVLKESDFRIVNKEITQTDEDGREAAFARRASWLRGLKGTPDEQLAQAAAEWDRFGVVEVRKYTVGDGRFPERIQVESVPGFPLEGVSDNRNLVAIHVPAATAAEEVLVAQTASAVLEHTGLSGEDVLIGYFDKIDPFGHDAGEPAEGGS